MYRELEFEEGKQLVLDYTRTYTCIAGEVPMYTEERLDKMNSYGFNLKIFYLETENTKGVIGFLDDYQNKNQLFLWVSNILGINTRDDLRDGVRENFKLLRDYAKSRNKNILTTRVVKWKDFKPAYRSLFDNWKDVYTEVATEFFVDFKIEDEEVMVFKLKVE